MTSSQLGRGVDRLYITRVLVSSRWMNWACELIQIQRELNTCYIPLLFTSVMYRVAIECIDVFLLECMKDRECHTYVTWHRAGPRLTPPLKHDFIANISVRHCIDKPLLNSSPSSIIVYASLVELFSNYFQGFPVAQRISRKAFHARICSKPESRKTCMVTVASI